MKTKRVVVGIPIIDSVPGEGFLSLVAAICEVYKCCSIASGGYNDSKNQQATVHVETPLNKFPHDIARSQVMDVAIKGDFDYLLFLDSDMVIPTIAYPELLYVLEKEKAAVVSGYYYRRGYPYTSVWSKNDASGEAFQVVASTGIFEIDFTGLGCALIDVKWVRENLTPPYFTMGVGVMSSEIRDDVSFFEKVKAKNGRVLGHAGIRCGHLGAKTMICDQNVEQLRKLFLGS